MSNTKQTILCPQCDTLQVAEVQHTIPFATYIHNCKCGYTVTESNWSMCNEVVYNLPTKRVVLRVINGKQRTFYESR